MFNYFYILDKKYLFLTKYNYFFQKIKKKGENHLSFMKE